MCSNKAQRHKGVEVDKLVKKEVIKMRYFLLKEKGFGAILPVAIMLVLIVLGLCVTFLVSHETKANVGSRKSNSAIYIADAGIEMSIYEFNRSTGPYSFGGVETFLPDSIDSKGSFIVSFSSSMAFPDRWEIESIGYVPNASSPTLARKIRAICERPDNPINVTSALAAGGNVRVGGNAAVDGGTLVGITVPSGSTATTKGSGTITGSPTATATAPFPSFEEIFSISFAQMESIATTKYNLPANNAVADRITWCNGDFQVTTSGWKGEGILIVNGDFKMTGGEFTGIIYVKGSFDMSGNASLIGGIFSENTADIELTTGTSSLLYTAAAEDAAEDLYPYGITSWKEMLPGLSGG